jgi:hypothetical protein
LSLGAATNCFPIHEEKNMQRLNSVNPQIAEGRTRQLLDAVEESLGVIPEHRKSDGELTRRPRQLPWL